MAFNLTNTFTSIFKYLYNIIHSQKLTVSTSLFLQLLILYHFNIVKYVQYDGVRIRVSYNDIYQITINSFKCESLTREVIRYDSSSKQKLMKYCWRDHHASDKKSKYPKNYD